MLFIQFSFGDFKDEDGLNLLPSNLKSIELPFQMTPAEAEISDLSGGTVDVSIRGIILCALLGVAL